MSNETAQKTVTALFLTYNTVGKAGAHPNGVTERNGRQAIIVQHPKGQAWGATVEGKEPLGLGQLIFAKNEEDAMLMLAAGAARDELVQGLYAGALSQEALKHIDFVVVYVGAAGSEGAIELAKRVPAGRVRFVLCDCNLDDKFRTIARSGITAQHRLCECGGHRTMEKILEEFLETGRIGLG